MKQLFPRGKRIRPTDKDLVSHTALAALFPVFLLVVLLFHIRQIAGTNWQEVSLSQIAQDVNIPCLLFSMGVAGLVCLAAVLLFWRYRRDEVKQLIHRQKLARMVLENKWYESKQRKEDAFFKDLSSSRSKETITYFPKIYYRMKQGLLHIRVEITLGKYQEQLLHLEKKLESGLYCELTDKELKDSYVEYTLLYDTIANRISIEDVQAKDGRLRLMENVWWEYDKLPHMLIAGGTGGGKTYFMMVGKPTPNKTNINNLIENQTMRASGEPPTAYGRYENIFLSKDEYDELQAEYPDRLERLIEEMSHYLAASGKAYQNYAAALHRWAANDKKGAVKQGIPDYTCMEGESL